MNPNFIRYHNILKISLSAGAFTPLTMEGNIVVDGVLASCYASTHHDLAHIGVTPMRWFPGMVQWIFGEDSGKSAYVSVLEEFSGWFLLFDN